MPQGDNKIIWTKEMLKYLTDNWCSMTNKELAEGLGLHLTVVRMQLYSMGMKRMELEYWTHEQIEFLKANYKKIGDMEMAEIFESMWPKQKTWTKKHIEKKRKYLHLHRTMAQQIKVHERNVANGRFKNCPVYAWDVRGRAKKGTIRIWVNAKKYSFKVIKLEQYWVHYAHWLWEQHYGPVPEGHMVTFKDGDNMNVVIENLILSNRKNPTLTDGYVAKLLSWGKGPEGKKEVLKVPQLISLKRAQLLLNETIKKHDTASKKRPNRSR